MSAYIVGLTGGIGSGKSTVADLFVEKGVVLVDADAIAHELTRPHGAAMPSVIAEFGPVALDAYGALDRTAMRQLVFAEPGARVRLENILHPLIRQISTERCQAAQSPYAILAVPLLIESEGYRQRCDRVVAVDCPEQLQIERVIARNGLSVGEVRAIMAAQATRAQRLAVANDVIINDADLANLAWQVNTLHEKYLQLSAEKPNASC